MTRAEIGCGVCGFHAVVMAQADAEGSVALEVSSDCSAVQRLAEVLHQVDPYTESGSFLGSSVYRAADACLRHPDCVVPAGILRAVNVEAGLALPHSLGARVARE